MERIGLHHEPKSQYAYALDEKRLALTLRTARGQVARVALLFGDPFDWGPGDSGGWEWRSARAREGHLHLAYSDYDYDYWRIEISPDWKRVRYAFLLEGRWLFTARDLYDLTLRPDKRYALSDYFNFPYINAEDIHRGPDWVKDTIWYQIFPERFCNGNPSLDLPGTLPWGRVDKVENHMRFGGDLEGIRSRLGYLKTLGITGIYFTPIFKATSTHKYDTIDYFQIDPAFGTNAEFKRLVQEAHGLGIRVMLDGVFNHCGFFHPFFQDVIEKGRASKYFDWFHILREPVVNFPLKNGYPKPHSHQLAGQLNYETFAFTPMMPKWRTGHPDCEAYLIEIGLYWIENFDIDGWRLDVSNEVSHDFWRKFRKAIKAKKPDCFLLGENWDDAGPWLKGDQFDGVMNYEWTTPIWRLLGTSKEIGDQLSPAAFTDAISKLMALTPEPIVENMFNLLDSHDTSRLATLFEGDISRLRLAYWLQMTFGGGPSIYYGSECALEGVNDGNRVCMPWSMPPEAGPLYNFIKAAIALRKAEPLLRGAAMYMHRSALPLICYDKIGGQSALRCFVNSTGAYQIVPNDLWPDHWTLLDGALWEESKIRLLEDGRRAIAPMSGVLLKLHHDEGLRLQT